MKLHRIIARSAAGALLAVAGAIGLAGSATAQNHPSAPPPNGPAKVLIIDRRLLMQASNVGQDIARQVQALRQSAESEFRSQGEALRKEQTTLKQQDAILAPDVREQKERAFQAKAQAFQEKARNRSFQIQYGVMLAERQVEQVAVPIVEQILQERGANLMIDRQSIVLAAPNSGLDVTKLAIDRLNQKLPTVKVQLATPPPEVMRQMLAQAASAQQ